MTKTGDALAILLQGLSQVSNLINQLFDTEASDKATIASLTQQRDSALAQVQTLTTQSASEVSDSDTATAIASAAEQLNAQLKQLSDKAAAATPATTAPVATTSAPNPA